MEFKFSHQQEKIRLLCNSSLRGIYLFSYKLHLKELKICVNVLSAINFQGEGNLC